jgi:lactate racemase-like protein
MRVEFEVPEQMLHGFLDPVQIPSMVRARYHMGGPAPVGDIAAVVAEQVGRPEFAGLDWAGKRVAIGVGSRGIARLAEITTALVSALRALGAEPFVFPSMGSHGGATAEGQRDVLAHFGVTEDRVGAPVRSSMETVEIGRTADGISVRLDRHALAADHIVFIGRVKPHTAFRGAYESGLAKMIAIGLGKQSGAAACHAAGFGDMARRIPLIAEVALANAPIRFGLAVLENAYDQPYKILAVPGYRILADEPALLIEAKQAMPSLPFQKFDVLVIDEIGKDMSGDGADPNVSGRYCTPFATGGPTVNKQVVLNLTDATDGNSMGLGMADFTTIRAARKMNWANTYPNALTATVPQPVALPMVLPSDRLAFAAALLTCNVVGRPPTLVRIANTLHIGELMFSASLLDQARADSRLELLGEPDPLPFDGEGNLLDLGVSALTHA